MITKLKWIAPCIMLFHLFTLTSRAQTQPVDTFESTVKHALTVYYKNYPQEKVYLHTNQSVYAGGQAIWYKAYVTAYGKPSALSKMMYVQLTDISGKLVAQNKLPIKNGVAHGNIDLPDSLRTGWYRLKAFTAWMLNFDDEGKYRQDIYIQHTADTLHRFVNDHQPVKYQVMFYPEGGDLVSGNICNVAFKATGDDGLPVNIYGEVVNNKNQPVAALKTLHDGMGVFSAPFWADSSYTAIIHFPDKTMQKVPLPEVKKEGIAMQVNTAPLNELDIRVAYTGPADKYKNVTMVAFQNNGRIATYPLQLGRGINVYGIKKDIFSTGTLRLTIFDRTGIPLAERLAFINNHDQLNLQLKADTLSIQAHKKQVFSLSVKDDAGKALSGNFSVTVTDAEAKINDGDENIASYLLLSNELRGNIHHPAWYFKNNSDTLQQQLDLVMLTNGWRHFEWKKVLGPGMVSLRYPVEGPQFIAGRILDYNSQLFAGKKQLLVKLIVTNQDSSKYIGFVTPDSLGRFILRDNEKSGVMNLFMEVSDTKNRVKKLKMNLFTTLDDSLKTVLPAAFRVNSAEGPPASAYFLSDAKAEQQSLFQARGILLKTVVIKQKKLSPTDEVIKDHVSPLFTSDREYTLDLVNNPSLDIGIINYMKGRFPGLRIEQSTDGGEAYFIYLDDNTLQSPSTPAKPLAPGAPDPNASLAKPYFYLNEAPVQDIGAIESIPMADIALIRFMPPPVFFAPYNGGNVGALLIYTKNRADDIRNLTSNEQFNKYTFNGYAITREFSSPDYGNVKNGYPPDNRTTLYWNHDLDSGSNGMVKFTFYNSDKAKKYRVIIQGMDAEGRLGFLDEVF